MRVKNMRRICLSAPALLAVLTLSMVAPASCNAERLIRIEKSGPDFADPGEVILWTIAVENLADFYLDDVTVEDELLGFSWHGGLQIGETNMFTLSFVIPDDAVGPLTNTAIVRAQIDSTIIYAEASWTVVIPVASTIDINPDTLNLRSIGKWITAYIELTEGFSVQDIDVSTIMLGHTTAVDSNAPIFIGDYDEDGIPDLMVKFTRAEVVSFLETLPDVDEVAVTITGVVDGTPFEGSDIVRITDG